VDLFDWAESGPRSRNTDPHTSHAAAERVGEFSHVHFRLIVAALSFRPGTIYDIGGRSGLTHVQVARRLPELEAMGRVAPNGTALGPTGRACRVWQLTVAQ
jgi:predicted ArsR family transcriptional regulator